MNATTSCSFCHILFVHNSTTLWIDPTLNFLNSCARFDIVPVFKETAISKAACQTSERNHQSRDVNIDTATVSLRSVFRKFSSLNRCSKRSAVALWNNSGHDDMLRATNNSFHSVTAAYLPRAFDCFGFCVTHKHIYIMSQ